MSKDNIQASPAEPGKEIKYVAIPKSLVDAIVNLIGSELSWGKAESVMSRLKTSCIAIDLAPTETEK